MNILVIGGGGREHAVVMALAKSKCRPTIFAAPGNGGISSIATCVNVAATDIEGIKKAVVEYKIDFVFVTPDDPLAIGMVDELEKIGVRAFGPNKAAARIESSKVFSKNLMQKYGIPTAAYETFDDMDKAVEYIRSHGKYPLFIKTDGLAAGKGAIFAGNESEAAAVLEKIMKEKAFGDSGNEVVIEDFLIGREVTILSFCDGKTVKPMISSQDHKRIFDGDQGGNTGGMGTFAPSPAYTPEIAEECMNNIFLPTVKAMQAEGCPFKGILYFGLIMTAEGVKVIEYNARFGDPETQVVLPLLQTDLFDIINAVIDGKLDEIEIEWDNKSAVCVIMSSGGYPDKYSTGYEITGLDNDVINENFTVYHAGTKFSDGKFFTSGGRVLGLTAVADNIVEARKKIYESIDLIDFKDKHFRKDIGIK